MTERPFLSAQISSLFVFHTGLIIRTKKKSLLNFVLAQNLNSPNKIRNTSKKFKFRSELKFKQQDIEKLHNLSRITFSLDSSNQKTFATCSSCNNAENINENFNFSYFLI